MALTRVNTNVLNIADVSVSLANDTTTGGIGASKLNKASPAFTGTLSGEAISVQHSSNIVSNLGNISGAVTLNLANADVFTCTIIGGTTFSFSGMTPNACNIVVVKITNGAGYTVAWPTQVTWFSGSAPTLKTFGEDVVAFFTADGGTKWYGIHTWK